MRSAADAERIAKDAATSAASPNARRIVVDGGAAACAGLEGLRRGVVPSSTATSASASSEMADASGVCASSGAISILSLARRELFEDSNSHAEAYDSDYIEEMLQDVDFYMD